ncbi:MAG TPA: AlpA family phage regulatory protein [Hyphomicrobiaceae bacterium]|nr:AlpA family phage regulatory protein [Hyphomicrobiaceae bacterium]
MTSTSSLKSHDSVVRPLSLAQVIEFTGVCRATIYEAIRDGKFPRHVKFGRRTFWLSDEIDAWVEGLRMARDQGVADADYAASSRIAVTARSAHKKRRLRPPAERAA